MRLFVLIDNRSHANRGLLCIELSNIATPRLVTGLSYPVRAVALDISVCPQLGIDTSALTMDFVSSDSICSVHGSPCCSDRYVILPILEKSLTVSHSDTGSEKKKLCAELGAENWIDFKETQDIVKAVREVCGGEGAHCAIVTTASGSGYTQAVDYLRPGGTLMAVGLPGEAKLEASIFFTVFKVGWVKKNCGFADSGIGTEYQHHWFIRW